ncbi:sugar ABC transporter permease [Paenibacillus sp. Soil766]|uniref:ABC transporter permease n=1 Tax=Paenibacillus sp. Soil766 TaxID=1736404 RepID=UPI00070CDDC2|nr:ABC transporter permease subunit [Paenibacillus sp. Soil766]KRF10289.1 sugar ABC transporter permease [Paenibacillus sp. Soil766]
MNTVEEKRSLSLGRKAAKSKEWSWKKNRDLTLMVLPAIIILILFNYVPMGGIVLAFKNYRVDQGIFGSEWSGFKNFAFFFQSQDAFRITRNTVGLNLLFIFTVMVGAMYFAIMLSEITKKKWLKLYQTSMFIPYFLSMPVVALLVMAFLDVKLGMVNSLFEQMHIKPVQWYGDPKLWPVLLTLINFWKAIGYNTLILYAALMGLDKSYYEAAEIDGATRWQVRFRITLPLLTPIVTIMIILQLGHVFYADFGLFYLVTQDTGVLYPTTDVIDTYVFRSLRVVGDIGMASAVGLYQAVIGFMLVIGINWIVRKFNPDNALF